MIIKLLHDFRKCLILVRVQRYMIYFSTHSEDGFDKKYQLWLLK